MNTIKYQSQHDTFRGNGSHINLFRDHGVWHYAAWINGEYDGSGKVEGAETDMTPEQVCALLVDQITGMPNPIVWRYTDDV